jgi:ATP-dependent RNA helicase DDX19/DBP5
LRSNTKSFKNFIGQSQSGTGKTAAFVLATLSRVDPGKSATQAITQITSTQALKDSIERGQTVRDHVIVGTPGTVMDLLKRRSIQGDSVQMLVIDEADVMLDMQGMGDQTLRIKKYGLPHNNIYMIIKMW